MSQITDTRNSDLTFAAGDVIGYYAPFGTPDPGNMGDLTSPWICLGWISTAGQIYKLNEAMKNIDAAGTLDPIRTIVTGAPKTFDGTFMEGMNPAVRSLYDDVPLSELQPATGTTIASYLMPEIPPLNNYAFLFDSFDGNSQMRSYGPQGKVTTRGNYQMQQEDATTVAMTITFYPQLIGSTRSALKHYIDYGTADLTAFYS